MTFIKKLKTKKIYAYQNKQKVVWDTQFWIFHAIWSKHFQELFFNCAFLSFVWVLQMETLNFALKKYTFIIFSILLLITTTSCIVSELQSDIIACLKLTAVKLHV